MDELELTELGRLSRVRFPLTFLSINHKCVDLPGHVRSQWSDVRPGTLVLIKLTHKQKPGSLAVVENVAGVVSVLPLNRTVTLKQCKNLLLSGPHAKEIPYYTHLSSLVQSLPTTLPDWDPDTKTDLDLDPPKPYEFQSNTVHHFIHMYFTHLYTMSTPVLYFLKSELVKRRSQYGPWMISMLTRLIHSLHSWKLKYEWLDSAVLGLPESKVPVREQQESKFVRDWLARGKSTTDKVNELRLRESQLQIFLLMELLVCNPSLDTDLNPSAALACPQGPLPRQWPESDALGEAFRTVSVVQMLYVAADRLLFLQAFTKTDSANNWDFCREALIPYYGHDLPTRVKSLVRHIKGVRRKPTRRTTSSKVAQDPVPPSSLLKFFPMTQETSHEDPPQQPRAAPVGLKRGAGARGGVWSGNNSMIEKRQIQMTSLLRPMPSDTEKTDHRKLPTEIDEQPKGSQSVNSHPATSTPCKPIHMISIKETPTKAKRQLTFHKESDHETIVSDDSS